MQVKTKIKISSSVIELLNKEEQFGLKQINTYLNLEKSRKYKIKFFEKY